MAFWEKVKKDLQKGWKEGFEAFKEGAIVVRKKAEILTEEGKRRYNIYEIKTKVQKEISDLGGKVYELSSKGGNPLLDKQVKTIITRVQKYEVQIEKLEAKAKVPSKKKAAKRVVKARKK